MRAAAAGRRCGRLIYAERAKLLGAVADVLVANRARYEEIAIANSGNTKIDAAIDIDGGIGTLKYYARLGAPLGEAKALLDEKPVRLAKAENFQAIHLLVPRHGVAVHINAFNFPSWGLWEKAACALLAGMPMLAKPASATCWLSHQMVRDVIAAKVLPEGALSLLCGGIGDLLDHVTADDVIAFTGSSGTANKIRRPSAMCLARGTCVNVEADSVNAALLAPGVAAATPAFDAFVKEVAREMTREGRAEMHRDPPHLCAGATGQCGDRSARRAAGKITVGDPRNEKTRMGPLVTRAQQDAALDGIRRLGERSRFRHRQSEPAELAGIDEDKSAFVAPTLLKVEDGAGQAVHDTEVFGPCATHHSLQGRGGRLRAGRARRRLAGRLGLRRGPRFPGARGGRSRRVARPHPGGRAVDRRCPYRPRHRHAAMPSRRSRPRRQWRRAWRPLRLAASIISAWRCRARPICSARCRRTTAPAH